MEMTQMECKLGLMYKIRRLLYQDTAMVDYTFRIRSNFRSKLYTCHNIDIYIKLDIDIVFPQDHPKSLSCPVEMVSHVRQIILQPGESMLPYISFNCVVLTYFLQLF